LIEHADHARRQAAAEQAAKEDHHEAHEEHDGGARKHDSEPDVDDVLDEREGLRHAIAEL
jgi:hypothetical protein